MIQTGWVLAVMPHGLAAIGPTDEIAIKIDAPPAEIRAIGAALAGGPAHDDAAALVELLREHGALGDAPADTPAGCSLADALAGAPGDVVWTAEEALILPAALDREIRARALHAFVAGLRPDTRRHAYALMAEGDGAVWGDRPSAERLAQRLAETAAAPALISVLDLAAEGDAWNVEPDRLDRIGATKAHRLGPILHSNELEPIDLEGDVMHVCVAEIAPADLREPSTRQDRIVQGVGTPELARVIAHAEGAERYAIAGHAGAEIVWARPSEQSGAVDPASLYAVNARQRADASAVADADPDASRPWCAAIARDGGRRWVPAEAIYPSIPRPEGIDDWVAGTSSGVAAHLRLDEARRRAFCELIERDAFMWTWLQQVSRELIQAATTPDDAAAWSRCAARDGWATHWVNLTLETLPVILCAMTHDTRGLVVGAACDGDPAEALRQATRQALILALRFEAPPGARVAPRDVRSPRDHLLLHLDPRRRADNGFLYASDDEIALADVPSVTAELPEDRLDSIGVEPLVVDLTRPASSPYVVVRALAPGLVPIAFGWDREPLGLEAVGRPRRTVCGLIVGSVLNGVDEAARLPHPFP